MSGSTNQPPHYAPRPDIPPNMGDDARFLARALHDLSDRMVEAHADTLTAAQVSAAVRDGLTDAVSAPAFWNAALTAITAHAQSEAGGIVFGGLKRLVSRLFWLTLICVGVYAAGGPGALLAFIKGSAVSGH